MVTLLAVVSFAQVAVDPRPTDQPDQPYTDEMHAAGGPYAGMWSSSQEAWMENAKTEARLALLLGDTSPAWNLTLIGKYDKDLVTGSAPPITGPKGKAGRADDDHDGKPDWQDLCPYVKAKKSDFGCPDIEYGVVSGREANVQAALYAYEQAKENTKYGINKDPFTDGTVDLDWDLRMIATGLFPEPEKRRKGDAPEPPPPAASFWSSDDDKDGLADKDDKCPSDPEDVDYFEDDDGCPDSDNDGDGIADVNDQCPSQAEDKDAFKDEDGCPDDDNDGDSIADAADSCPNEPGAGSGCPGSSYVAPGYTAPKPVYTAPVKQVYQEPAPVYTPPKPKPLPSVDMRLATGKKSKNDAAVVIGLEDYFAIADVPYARRDADAFYSFLLYTRGVPQEKIQSLSSGGKEHIAAAVERAGREVGPGGTVWVYFAGHGAANPSSGQRMLLGDDVRSDAIGFASRGIEVGEIEKLASVNGGVPMLVLDTCYSGAGRTGGTLIAGTRFAVPQFQAKASAPGAMEWNAASADQISAPFEPAQHGAFTYFAVGALRGWADGEIDGTRDGRVTGSEAQAYVRRALRAHQKNDQQPVWVGPNDPVLSEGASESGPEF